MEMRDADEEKMCRIILGWGSSLESDANRATTSHIKPLAATVKAPGFGNHDVLLWAVLFPSAVQGRVYGSDIKSPLGMRTSQVRDDWVLFPATILPI